MFYKDLPGHSTEEVLEEWEVGLGRNTVSRMITLSMTFFLMGEIWCVQKKANKKEYVE